jgi:hypothetical protein
VPKVAMLEKIGLVQLLKICLKMLGDYHEKQSPYGDFDGASADCISVLMR